MWRSSVLAPNYGISTTQQARFESLPDSAGCYWFRWSIMRTENSVDTAKPTPVAVCATPSSAKEDVEKKKKKAVVSGENL